MKKIFYYLFLLLGCYANCFAGETSINNETTLTLHVEVPGTLSDLIFDAGTRPVLVAKLTLTGTLNDADFTCMRETMTSLVNVDLSGITNTSGVNFNGKARLVRIILPTNLTSIGENAFSNCLSLTSITIPNSVTSIGGSAFVGCSSLTSITIPSSVTSIGSYAFDNCSSLTSVTIPNSVTSIGHYAFAGCTSLTSITIPNSVTSIGECAFYYCSSLTSVTIGNSVTSILGGAFAACTSLTSIICFGTTPPEASNLGANTSTCKLIVPHSAYNAYLRHAYWGQFLNIVSGDWVENRDMTIIFTNSEDNNSEILSQTITIKVPVAPEIEGFTFLYWQPVAEPLTDVITIQAIYEANAPASAPEVYINPANPAQKLLRNGQVYILKDDKTYTIMGAQIQ